MAPKMELAKADGTALTPVHVPLVVAGCQRCAAGIIIHLHNCAREVQRPVLVHGISAPRDLLWPSCTAISRMSSLCLSFSLPRLFLVTSL